jgi:hypothetical protein
VLGSSKATNVACLAVFDLGTDSALSRQSECVKKKSHMRLYDTIMFDSTCREFSTLNCEKQLLFTASQELPRAILYTARFLFACERNRCQPNHRCTVPLCLQRGLSPSVVAKPRLSAGGKRRWCVGCGAAKGAVYLRKQDEDEMNDEFTTEIMAQVVVVIGRRVTQRITNAENR